MIALVIGWSLSLAYLICWPCYCYETWFDNRQRAKDQERRDQDPPSGTPALRVDPQRRKEPMTEEKCPDCDGYGYVVTREANWGPEPQPEESEPCWCMASVRKGWISLEDHLAYLTRLEQGSG